MILKFLLYVALALVLLYALRKLPQVARTVGGSIRAFREGKNEHTPEANLNKSSKSR